MTIPNFETLANTPGVTFKQFCSFACTEEASGDIEYEVDEGDKVVLPVCEKHAMELLDRQNNAVVD